MNRAAEDKERNVISSFNKANVSTIVKSILFLELKAICALVSIEGLYPRFVGATLRIFKLGLNSSKQSCYNNVSAYESEIGNGGDSTSRINT